MVLNLLCLSGIFRFCTLSPSGFSVEKQKRYATSLRVNMTSYVNVSDVKGTENRYVCQIVNKKKKILFLS